MYRLAVYCIMVVLSAGLMVTAPGTVAAAGMSLGPADAPTAAWVDGGGQGGDPAAVELTERQKKRLAKAYDRLFKAHAELIDLYAEYGLISEEQKERKMRWLQKHREWIEANGYRPYIEKHRKDHHHRDGGTESQTPSQ